MARRPGQGPAAPPKTRRKRPEPLGVKATGGVGVPVPKVVHPVIRSPEISPMGDVNARINNIHIGYHLATGRFPSPLKVLDVLASPVDLGMWTPEDYSTLFEPGGSVFADQYPDINKDDWSPVSETETITEKHSYRIGKEGRTRAERVIVRPVDFTQPEFHINWSGFGMGMPTPDLPEITSVQGVLEGFGSIESLAPQSTIRAQYQTGIGERKHILDERGFNDVTDIEGNKQHFDPKGKDWGEQEDKAYRAYIFSGTLAYALWGDKREKDKAAQLISSVTNGFIGQHGMDVTDVMDALGYRDEDEFNNTVYSGFIAGRPSWMSEIQGRNLYAQKFGEGRMPVSAQKQYKEESSRFATLALAWAGEKATASLGWVKDRIESVPYAGPAANDFIDILGHGYSKWDTQTNRAAVTLWHTMGGNPASTSEWAEQWRKSDNQRLAKEVFDDLGIYNPVAQALADMTLCTYRDVLLGRGILRFGVKPGSKAALVGVGAARKLPAPVSKLIESPIFDTHLDTIVATDNAFAIGRAYSIPHNPKLKSLVTAMADTTDRTEAATFLGDVRKLGVDIDPGAAALLKGRRARTIMKGRFGDWWGPVQSTLTRTVPDRVSKLRTVEEQAYNIGLTSKMGKGSAFTSADATRASKIADKIYRIANDTDEGLLARRAAMDKLWTEIGENMANTPAPTDKGILIPLLGKKKVSKIKTLGDYYKAFESVYPDAHMTGPHARGYAWDSVRVGDRWELRERKVVPAGTTKRLNGMVDEAEADWKKLLLKAGMDEGEAAQRIEYARRLFKEHLADPENIPVPDSPDGLRAAQQEFGEFRRAVRTGNLERWSQSQPFYNWQLAKSYTHQYNPRRLALFMSGPGGRALELSNIAHAGPLSLDYLTQTYKRLLMISSPFSFPLRVQIGDELMRLVPEGTAKPWRLAGAVKTMREFGKTEKEIKAAQKAVEMGKVPEMELPAGSLLRFPEELRGDLYEWAGRKVDSWEPSIGVGGAADPDYFKWWSGSVRANRKEPVVSEWKRLRGEGLSVSAAAKRLRNLANADSPEGERFRLLLYNTTRVTATEDRTYNTAMARRYVDDWINDLEAWEQSQAMREVLFENKPITVERFRKVPETVVVNNEERVCRTPVVKAGKPVVSEKVPYDPVSWAYEHSTGWALDKFGTWLRELVWSDHYNQNYKKIAKRNPEMSEEDVHDIASELALKDADRASYTNDSSVMEGLMRNQILFLPAYRQFAAYWARVLGRHPVAMYGAQQRLMVDEESFSVPGKNIPVVGNALRDFVLYRYPIPFWASAASENLPASGPLHTVPARLISHLSGEDVVPQGLPGAEFASTRKTAMFGGWDDLMWGVTGWNIPVISKDRSARERAAIAITQGQIERGMQPDVTKGIAEMQDKPWFYDLMEHLGFEHPEGIISGLSKKVLPVSVAYIPEEAQNLQQAKYDFLAATTEEERQKILTTNPKFATIKQYYWSDAADRAAMLEDPKNAWLHAHVGYKTDYSGDGKLLVAEDWVRAMGDKQAQYKSVDEYVDSVQQIWGGALIPEKRTGTAGRITYAQARTVLDAKVKSDNTWAKVAAKRASHGNKRVYNEMMDSWTNPHVSTDAEGNVVYAPSGRWILVPGVSSHMSGNDEERLRLQYGEEPSVSGIQEGELQGAARIHGLLPRGVRGSVVASTAYGEDLLANVQRVKDDANKKVAAFTLEPNYDLDIVGLRLIGVKNANKQTQKAIAKAQDFYYKWDDWTNGKTKMFMGVSNGGKRLDYWDDAYAAGRWKFIQRHDAIMRAAPGGDYLASGVGKRISRMDVLTKYDFVLPKGHHAARLLKLVNEVLKYGKSEDPSWDVVRKKYRLSELPPQTRAAFDEILRVQAWRAVALWGVHYRNKLKSSWSEFYGTPANSIYSKVGEQYTKEMSVWLKTLAKLSPGWKKDADTYFGAKEGTYDTFARSLIDWGK